MEGSVDTSTLPKNYLMDKEHLLLWTEQSTSPSDLAGLVYIVESRATFTEDAKFIDIVREKLPNVILVLVLEGVPTTQDQIEDTLQVQRVVRDDQPYRLQMVDFTSVLNNLTNKMGIDDGISWFRNQLMRDVSSTPVVWQFI